MTTPDSAVTDETRQPTERRPTHAELAAQVPPAPPDAENEAIQFAKKTLMWTVILAVGFVGAVVVAIL